MATTMAIKDRLQAEVKTALRAGDKPRVSALRMALAAIQQREVDERTELDETQSLSLLEKLIKQRRESAEQYRAGGRPELAAREEAEVEVLAEFLPEPLAEAEIDALIREAIETTGAQGPRDMGQVMTWLRERAAGRADMSELSRRVKSLLTG